MTKKNNKFFRILRIFLLIGWIGFMAWNFYLWTFLLKQYDQDPSSFVFFESEKDREQYKESRSKLNPGLQGYEWIDQVSLVDQCRPMIYFKDFFLDKVKPFIILTFLLIILTLIYRLGPEEIEDMKKLVDKFDKE